MVHPNNGTYPGDISKELSGGIIQRESSWEAMERFREAIQGSILRTLLKGIVQGSYPGGLSRGPVEEGYPGKLPDGGLPRGATQGYYLGGLS